MGREDSRCVCVHRPQLEARPTVHNSLLLACLRAEARARETDDAAAAGWCACLRGGGGGGAAKKPKQHDKKPRRPTQRRRRRRKSAGNAAGEDEDEDFEAWWEDDLPLLLKDNRIDYELEWVRISALVKAGQPPERDAVTVARPNSLNNAMIDALQAHHARATYVQDSSPTPAGGGAYGAPPLKFVAWWEGTTTARNRNGIGKKAANDAAAAGAGGGRQRFLEASNDDVSHQDRLPYNLILMTSH